ncbi:MAG: flagellar filament capping protein FliD [Candidatus Zixiibacteriota bacterium]
MPIQSIEGLASNLDISGIVDTIMSYEQYPVTLLEQDKALKTQQVAAYKAFEAKLLALKSQVLTLKKESSFNKASIQVSDETILSVTSNGRITPGSYDLRVTALARNHQIASQGFNSATDSLFGTGTIQLAVGSASTTTIAIDSGNNSLIGIKDAINDANIGISASIINDGSTSNPYRLLLTSNKTGAANNIRQTVSLSGSQTVDFMNSSFDGPETVSFSTGTTTAVSLGSVASFTGSTNKTYTFTVAGSGAQTIGTDNVTINWTDGTNSGSIVVTNADADVDLIGDGANGLSLSFSAGDLVGGDTFQVGTFAPLLQSASDAKIQIGSSDSGGSPIVISSATNRFEDVLPGLTIDAKKVNSAGESITINTDVDSNEIKNMVSELVAKYNDIMNFVDDQFTYDKEKGESGVLFADYSLQVMQSTLRLSTTSIVKGLQDGINSLASIGIRTGQNGELKIMNSAKLTDAIQNDFDNFISLFVDSGIGSSSYIEFISATEKTVQGEDYIVDITQAATKGYFQGASINDPAVSSLTLDSTNNKIKIKVDGIISNEIALSERSYTSGADLVNEIQTRIDADSKIGGRGLTVEWVQMSDSGYLKFSSGTYGSGSKVIMESSTANNAYSITGLAGGSAKVGQNVAGTINGELATGNGQVLSGDEGNATTEGLKLKITYTESMVSSATEGSFSYVSGLATKLNNTLENMTKSIDGTVPRRTLAINNQLADIDEQIERYTDRLARRREDLYAEFLAMEQALSEFQSEGSYLESQLAGLQSNWNQISSNNSK